MKAIAALRIVTHILPPFVIQREEVTRICAHLDVRDVWKNEKSAKRWRFKTTKCAKAPFAISNAQSWILNQFVEWTGERIKIGAISIKRSVWPKKEASNWSWCIEAHVATNHVHSITNQFADPMEKRTLTNAISKLPNVELLRFRERIRTFPFTTKALAANNFVQNNTNRFATAMESLLRICANSELRNAKRKRKEKRYKSLIRVSAV